jgi:hypothetical protein
MESENNKMMYGSARRNGSWCLGLYNLFHTLEDNAIDYMK